MNRTSTVTASEIAEFVYCPEAWRLAALGHESANQPARDAGHAHHAEKAGAERRAGGAIAFGFGLIILAALAAAILWWLRR